MHIKFCFPRMNNNIVGMETNMEQLLEKVWDILFKWVHTECPLFFSSISGISFMYKFLQILSVQSRSDGVNTSLFEKREHIEKLHRTRNLLRKVQVFKVQGICWQILLPRLFFHALTLNSFIPSILSLTCQSITQNVAI